jgi:hypothetical protein
VANIEWHPGGLYPSVGFVVSNLGATDRPDKAKTTQRSNGSSKAQGREVMPRLRRHVLAYNLAG